MDTPGNEQLGRWERRYTKWTAVGTAVYADVGKIISLEVPSHCIGETCKPGCADYGDVPSDMNLSEKV